MKENNTIHYLINLLQANQRFSTKSKLKKSGYWSDLSSIQAKIWGNIGQVKDLIDMVLDTFIKRSVTGGLGSAQAEIMAETLVSLSASNVALVAKKVIWRLCRVIDKTCISPTTTLEQHINWDDIANLARYLLMLSFNNSLDVVKHLPYLFHIVTLLVCTGQS